MEEDDDYNEWHDEQLQEADSWMDYADDALSDDEIERD